MEPLPHNAIIVSERYDFIAQHDNIREFCLQCEQPFTPDVFVVGIPSMLIDGVLTEPDRTMVCSQACALNYLASFNPKPHRRHDCGIPAEDGLMPTTVQETGWIYEYSKASDYPLAHPLRSGKWLVFLSTTTTDRYWQKIREAVIAGKMGDCAKVSTAGSAKAREGRHVICVYTYDYEDKADVMRIRQALRDCGILRPIRYKRDLDTMLLRYNSDYAPIYKA